MTCVLFVGNKRLKQRTWTVTEQQFLSNDRLHQVLFLDHFGRVCREGFAQDRQRSSQLHDLSLAEVVSDR